jgi:SAM-dependent methyltransferase
MTDSLIEAVEHTAEIPGYVKYYWGYQYRLGLETLHPYLARLGAFAPGKSVAEIGSAEGGVLAAFVKNGASSALGTDIAKERLDFGKRIAALEKLPMAFIYHNVMTEEPLSEWIEKFDLVLLRDVIEHLDDTQLALHNIKKIIKPGGYLFVTFPPYHSPFGGHQHTLASLPGKIPYIHLLPDFLFHSLIASGRPADIEEVKRLQHIKLTPNKFMHAVESAGFQISHADYYLLRPVFKMKFGLPAVQLTSLSSLPLVKSFFSLEAAYLLKK